MTTYRVTFSAIVEADDEDGAIEEAERHFRDEVCGVTVEEYDEETGQTT